MNSTKPREPGRMVLQKVQGRLTDAEYADGRGHTCPFCRTTGGLEMADDDTPFELGEEGEDTFHLGRRLIRCKSCNVKFFDIYAIVGYATVDDPDMRDGAWST